MLTRLYARRFLTEAFGLSIPLLGERLGWDVCLCLGHEVLRPSGTDRWSLAVEARSPPVMGLESRPLGNLVHHDFIPDSTVVDHLSRALYRLKRFWGYLRNRDSCLQSGLAGCDAANASHRSAIELTQQT